ncbi:hypothetical protein [Myceligenerans xiligouense]|uniref:Uncharacterized protein n=1 Tax=Myceligenerans xiligouense TaxID=253184 RepID=A0A3N4YNU5_9MICO|nr:hypothetical protein [Myceligenerans xiligouense]RPF21126.1 hypothetical protein EDD34_1745 [Myceligenerans xiligouense]
MSTIQRRRIHLTETPRLAEIIERNSIPGEPRAATVARLVERADAILGQDADFVVFPGRPLTDEQVQDLLEEEDNDRIAEAFRD